MARRRSFRRHAFRKTDGYKSEMVVTMASWYTNWSEETDIFQVSQSQFVFNLNSGCLLQTLNMVLPHCPTLKRWSWQRRRPPTAEEMASTPRLVGKQWRPSLVLKREKRIDVKKNMTISWSMSHLQHTWFSHQGYIHTLLFCHETEHRENSKTGHKAGETVQQAQENTVPVGENMRKYPKWSKLFMYSSWLLQNSTKTHTYNSCCCTCCSFLMMSKPLCKLHRSRKSGFQHPSIPGKCQQGHVLILSIQIVVIFCTKKFLK